MGAWGAETFENDDAMDWVTELEPAADQALVEKALRQVVGTKGQYIEAYDAAVGLAAAEVVAGLAGRPSDTVPEGVSKWVTNHTRLSNRSLLDLAVEAVQRVRSNSELKELWEEKGAEDWNNFVNSLYGRLREAASNIKS